MIIPDWPAPPSIRALTTTREGGVSQGPYASLNLAGHVGDDPRAVAENRARLERALRLPASPCWLRQIHSSRVVEAKEGVEADGSFTYRPGIVCAVLTADCLPVLLCDPGGQVAAVHAGWRGLAAGVLEAALAAFPSPHRVMAWLGPAIGPAAYEVGEEVKGAFPEDGEAFHPQGGRWRADLPRIAQRRLKRAGVRAIYESRACTFESRRFFSYRRDGITGRMATLIWIEP